mgnify:CR=1 FL=1
MTTVVMSELLSNAPFEDFDVGEDSFVPVNEMVGRKVEFLAVKPFENSKGPGVYILFRDAQGIGYTTTHSGALINIFNRPEVLEALNDGDTLVEGTIVQRKSKLTGNTYFAVE